MTDRVGSFEMEALMAVWQLNENAYGVSIGEKLFERTGSRPSVGKLYSTLERLGEKGYVESRMGEKTAERGGRRKKFFRITGLGRRVASEQFNRISALAVGLPVATGITR